MIVVGTDSIEKSKIELLAFQQAFSEIIRRNKMQFYVVVLDGAKQKLESDQEELFSSIEPEVSTIWLTQESSQQFQELVQLPWLPSWFLIDRNGILKHVNTSGPLLRSQIVDFVAD